MKSELDTEVDRLLRAHARRSGEGRATEHDAIESAIRTTATSLHLDADAISLYAEKALPPHALAGYTQHLVECDQCRARLAMYARMDASEIDLRHAVQSVAADETTPAASVVANTADEPSLAGWWTRFTETFFAPRNLAFALPVLALFLVGITVFLITAPSNREPAPLVADTTQPTTAMSGNTNMSANMNMAMNANMSPEASSDAMREQATSATSRANVMTGEGEETNTALARREVESVKPDQPAAQPSAVPALPTANELAGSGTTADFMRTPTPPSQNPAALPSNNRAATAPAPPPPSLEARQQMAEKRKNDGENVSVTADEVIAVENSPRIASANANTGDASTAARREANTSLGMTATARRARRSTVNRDRSDSDADRRAKEANAGTASRIVGNRRFTRRNSVWVDESYKEGTAITNVRRGSEQFRALVADEPGLRQIAETLAGDVIVVRKNRAYRIK